MMVGEGPPQIYFSTVFPTMRTLGYEFAMGRGNMFSH